MVTLSIKDKFNTKDKYNGALLELNDLSVIKLEYAETKVDLQLKKKDLMNMIPSLFTHDEIGSHLTKYKEAMDENPNWLTYLILYPDYECTWDFAGKLIYHAPLYTGRGTVDRVLSHAVPQKHSSKAEERLNSYIVGFRANKIEPILLILAKGLNEEQSKRLEADTIKLINIRQHYITGDRELALAPRFLNQREELSNEGWLIKTDNTFGRTRP